MSKKLKVLIIEDSESDSELTIRQLEKEGYTVEASRVESEEQFSIALQTRGWDVIIADYRLPGFSAPLALSMLKQTEMDIPFIVISGAIGEETAVSLMRTGACDYLMKNNLVRLASVIERELTELQLRNERKLALKALLESENNLRKSQRIAHIGHWVIDYKTGNIDCSEEMIRILGINRSDCGGDLLRAWQERIHPDDLCRVWIPAHQQMQCKQCPEHTRMEYRVIHTDGSIHHVLDIIGECAVDREGNVVHLSGVLQDITDRKLAEKQIQRWADAFQHCAQGISMCNPKTGQVIICNPTFARIRGETISDIIGRPVLSLYPEDEHDFVRSKIAEADRFGQVSFETRMTRQYGQPFSVQIDIASVRDENQHLIYRIATMHDISRRKQAEVALRQEMAESKLRAREMEAISYVSSSMRQAHSKAELVDIIVNKLKELMAVDFVRLAILDRNDVYFQYGQKVNRSWMKIIAEEDIGKYKEMMRNGQPLIIHSVQEEAWISLPEWLKNDLDKIESLMIYPLNLEANIIGFIILGFQDRHEIRQELINMMTAVSDMAGSALNRMLAVENLEIMVERREKELESIYQVTSASSKTLDINEALREALKHTLDAVHSSIGAIYLLKENNRKPELSVQLGYAEEIQAIVATPLFDDFLSRVSSQKKPVVIPCVTSSAVDAEAVSEENQFMLTGLPMRNQDRIIGILVIMRKCREQVNIDEMTLLSFIADQLALVVENTRLYKNAENSAILNERSRLARELHDSVTQSLYSASLYAVGAQRYAAVDNYQQVDTYLAEIGTLTNQSLKDMRLLVYELRSPELIQSGLLGALQTRLDAVERRSKIAVNLETNIQNSLPEKIEENLYWIAIEALNNSLKHARASKVIIRIFKNDQSITMEISDNGEGFEYQEHKRNGGVGLLSMRERADSISAVLKIFSSQEEGTRVEIIVPINEVQFAVNGGEI